MGCTCFSERTVTSVVVDEIDARAAVKAGSRRECAVVDVFVAVLSGPAWHTCAVVVAVAVRTVAVNTGVRLGAFVYILFTRFTYNDMFMKYINEGRGARKGHICIIFL